VKTRAPRELRLVSTPGPAETSGDGWKYWRGVWAAWCPTCRQETMPFPSGRSLVWVLWHPPARAADPRTSRAATDRRPRLGRLRARHARHRQPQGRL